MSNPFDDFVSEYLPAQEKTAFFGTAMGELGKGVATGLGAATAAAAVAGVGMAATNVYRAATKSRDFRSMLSFNPDLQEHHDRDPRTFNQMYSSLRTMNPHFSQDPIVAGTYMRRMVENPLTAGGILTESVPARDKFVSPLSNSIDTGATVGAKSVDLFPSPRQSPRPMLRQQQP